MISKIVILFLIFIGVLGMLGGLRLRMPAALRKLGQRRADLPRKPGKCRRCGAPRVGRGPCPCGEA